MNNLFISNLITNPLYFARYVVIIVFSIVIHELSHGFAAIGQGDDTPAESGHLTPNPAVHMGAPALIMLVIVGMTWGQMPVNPSKFRHRWSHAWVAFAGPLSNLVLSILAVLVMVVSQSRGLTLLSPEFFYLMAFINAFLFIFNMLPIPPFDGFTVMSDFVPSLKALRQTPQIGLALLMIIFLVLCEMSTTTRTSRQLVGRFHNSICS